MSFLTFRFAFGSVGTRSGGGNDVYLAQPSFGNTYLVSFFMRYTYLVEISSGRRLPYSASLPWALANLLPTGK